MRQLKQSESICKRRLLWFQLTLNAAAYSLGEDPAWRWAVSTRRKVAIVADRPTPPLTTTRSSSWLKLACLNWWDGVSPVGLLRGPGHDRRRRHRRRRVLMGWVRGVADPLARVRRAVGAIRLRR